YRVIAHDRRGHGRSDQPSEGNDMDTYADDLAQLIESLDLKDITMIGHSTGGGEVARYIGRHGNDRVRQAVLISAVPPIMISNGSYPNGVPIEVFDGIRKGVASDRSQYYKDLAVPFFGFNKPDAKISQGLIDGFWLQSMQGSVKGHYDCIAQFSATDFTADLKKITVPTLVLHGDADQIVPIDHAGRLTAEIVANATLKVYPGASHGMCSTEAATINADLLAFLEG
ncbi:alpha/beta hydrolase, partial [bacterium]